MRNLDRNERLFGREGQQKISGARLAIVGAGGLGMHVIQQTTLLGTIHSAPIDNETLGETDLNRYIGVGPNDIGTLKVILAERLIKSIEPTAIVNKVQKELTTPEAFAAIKDADVVFGCLDNEGARLILTELCAAYGKPLFDLASDTETQERTRYGGRIIAAFIGNGCPVCLGELDTDAARQDLDAPAQRRQRDDLYGIRQTNLDGTGPAIVSINGVIASLAVTEFMTYITGMRPPRSVLTYRGDLGIVMVRKEPAPPDCYYCHGIWNQGERAGVERYLWMKQAGRAGAPIASPRPRG